MLKAICFDAAGTLFRVRGCVGLAYAGVAARHGVTVGADEIEASFRSAFRRMPPLCFPGVAQAELPRSERGWWRQVVTAAFHGYTFADFDAFFGDLFQHFAGADAWELFPDVRPALKQLKMRGLRLGVISNFDGRLTAVCAGLGIAGCFDSIVMSGRAGYAKPDPRIFAIALRQLGVSAAQALHVGDSETDDLRGAQAAGMQAVLIQRESPAAAGTDRVGDLRELLSRC